MNVEAEVGVPPRRPGSNPTSSRQPARTPSGALHRPGSSSALRVHPPATSSHCQAVLPPAGRHSTARPLPHTPRAHTAPLSSPGGRHSTADTQDLIIPQTCSLYGLPCSVKGTRPPRYSGQRRGTTSPGDPPLPCPPAPTSHTAAQPPPKHRPDTPLPGPGPSNGSTPMGPEDPEPSHPLNPSLPPPSLAGLQTHR